MSRSLTNLGKDENPDKPLMGSSNSPASCTSQRPKFNLSKSSDGRWLRRDKLNLTDYQQLRQLYTKLMVWDNDCVPYPVLPSSRGYGWTMENDEWIPVMTTLSPDPKERCTANRYQCRITGLLCMNLCSCSDDDDECENQQCKCDNDNSDIEDEEDDDDALNKIW